MSVTCRVSLKCRVTRSPTQRRDIRSRVTSRTMALRASRSRSASKAEERISLAAAACGGPRASALNPRVTLLIMTVVVMMFTHKLMLLTCQKSFGKFKLNSASSFPFMSQPVKFSTIRTQLGLTAGQPLKFSS